MASESALLLSELTSTMMREVFRAVNDSAMEQLEAYVELSAKISVPEETYVAGLLGATPEAQQKTAESYVRGVVLPSLSLPAEVIPELLFLSDAHRETLQMIFAGVTVNTAGSGEAPELHTIDDLLFPSGNKAFPWAIKGPVLVLAAREKLARDARLSYAKLLTMLRAGLPNVSVSGGQICTKVTMSTTLSTGASAQAAAPSGKTAALSPSAALASTSRPALAVRVANERSAAFARSQELIGSVRIDFRAGTFPPLVPLK